MIISKKIAIKHKDCCIIVEYTDTDSKKRRHRKIYLQDVITSNSPEVNKDTLFEKIYTGILEKHHKRYLKNVDKSLLKKLVISLIEYTTNEYSKESKSDKKPVSETVASRESEEDTHHSFNDEDSLEQTKETEDVENDFEGQGEYGDDGFYDDFQEGFEHNEFDEDEIIKDENEFDYEDNFGDDFEDNYGLDDDNNESQQFQAEDDDLNVVSQEELVKAKQRMDIEFEQNRKKPGDSDFQYEVEQDFSGKQTEPSGWDSD
jgi:hypothetical protein